MEKIEKLTKIQEEIMCIFWGTEEALNINEVINLNKNLGLSVHVIRSSLKELVKNGFLEEFREDRNKAVTYVVTITYAEYIMSELDDCINIGSYNTIDVVKALISNETYRFNIDGNELVEIYNLISNRIKEYFEYDEEQALDYEEEYTEVGIDEFLSNLEISLNDLFFDKEFIKYVLELQNTANELKINLIEMKEEINDLEARFSKSTRFISKIVNCIEK